MPAVGNAARQAGNARAGREAGPGGRATRACRPRRQTGWAHVAVLCARETTRVRFGISSGFDGVVAGREKPPDAGSFGKLLCKYHTDASLRSPKTAGTRGFPSFQCIYASQRWLRVAGLTIGRVPDLESGR